MQLIPAFGETHLPVFFHWGHLVPGLLHPVPYSQLSLGVCIRPLLEVGLCRNSHTNRRINDSVGVLRVLLSVLHPLDLHDCCHSPGDPHCHPDHVGEVQPARLSCVSGCHLRCSGDCVRDTLLPPCHIQRVETGHHGGQCALHYHNGGLVLNRGVALRGSDTRTVLTGEMRHLVSESSAFSPIGGGRCLCSLPWHLRDGHVQAH